MKFKVKLGGFEFTQDSNSNWIAKSSSNALKKDGTLKAAYRDLPRYKMIPKWESEHKRFFENLTKRFVKNTKKNLDV